MIHKIITNIQRILGFDEFFFVFKWEFDGLRGGCLDFFPLKGRRRDGVFMSYRKYIMHIIHYIYIFVVTGGGGRPLGINIGHPLNYTSDCIIMEVFE